MADSQPSAVKTSSITFTDPKTAGAYYVDATDSSLYTVAAGSDGKEYVSKKANLPEICAGASTNEDDKFVSVTSLGSILALQQSGAKAASSSKITVCDTEAKKLVADFDVPESATSLLQLAAVPVGKDKGGHKVVWSSLSGDKQQIGETHVFNSDDSASVFTFENMYEIEKDAILQIS